MTARCTTCGATAERPTLKLASDWLWNHDAIEHRDLAPIHQLPQIAFREQALAAIRALAIAGKPFTIGDAHPMVSVPPINPQTEWPSALREAINLGWVAWTGEYAESKVPTTKRSAVKVWRGTSRAAA